MTRAVVTITAADGAVIRGKRGRLGRLRRHRRGGGTKLVLDEALLKSFPSTTVDVTFETSSAKSAGRHTGVRLWDFLQKSGLMNEPGKCGEMTGRDGYAVALAIGELNPHFQGKPSFWTYAGSTRLRQPFSLGLCCKAMRMAATASVTLPQSKCAEPATLSTLP